MKSMQRQIHGTVQAVAQQVQHPNKTRTKHTAQLWYTAKATDYHLLRPFFRGFLSFLLMPFCGFLSFFYGLVKGKMIRTSREKWVLFKVFKIGSLKKAYKKGILSLDPFWKPFSRNWIDHVYEKPCKENLNKPLKKSLNWISLIRCPIKKPYKGTNEKEPCILPE